MLSAAAPGRLMEKWSIQRGALSCSPFVSHGNLNAEKINYRNGVEELESLRFHLALRTFGPIGDVLRDFILVTGRRIGKMVCPIV